MNSSERFDTWLTERLKKELPGFEAQVKMTRHLNRPPSSEAPDDVRLSAVLLLIYFKEEDPHLVIIKRTEDNGPHSGQMAFPGGKKEDEDITLLHTAIREAQEEINLNESNITIVGELTSLYIPVSNYIIYPYVAIDSMYNYWELSPYEVQSIHSYPLQELFESKKETEIHLPVYNQKIKTVAYMPEDNIIIWGATAMIISELEELYNEYKSISM